jgi:hypothetical protein
LLTKEYGCQKILALRYQAPYLLSPPASLNGSCSGIILWSLILHPIVKKREGYLFSIPPVEIFKKKKGRGINSPI